MPRELPSAGLRCATWSTENVSASTVIKDKITYQKRLGDNAQIRRDTRVQVREKGSREIEVEYLNGVARANKN